MAANINFHPSEALLRGYADGTLSAGLNVVISAHLEQCKDCRDRVAELENIAACEWVESSKEMLCSSDYDGSSELGETDIIRENPTAKLSHLVTDITSHPQHREMNPADESVTEIHMLDHSVRLPKVLARAASDGLVWKKMTSGINQASVMLDDQTQCEFLYIKPGAKVPVHKHQGTEVTLVLDGSFTDEMGKYQKSDFVMRNKTHTHHPASEEGCLCFSVLDSPLTFTSGLARLLNPFLRYRFSRATSMS
ncbi:MAG: ChrR family anti-sigma-E factor [Gammaproteobacteria bacterium]|nr:ChrR family anti-sigma-E factor [Gammaproteobacteria bacterium]